MTSSFLNLPAELRNLIYDEAYKANSLSHQRAHFRGKPNEMTDSVLRKMRVKQLSLHQVNRQLRQECFPYYLRCNTFIFDLTDLDAEAAETSVLRWAESLGDERLALVKDLVITMRANPSHTTTMPLFAICFWGRMKLRGIRRTERALDISLGDARCSCCHLDDARWFQACCSRNRFQQYRQVVDELTTRLDAMNWRLSLREGKLSLGNIEDIAAFGQRLRFLCIQPRPGTRCTQSTGGSEVDKLANSQEVTQQVSSTERCDTQNRIPLEYEEMSQQRSSIRKRARQALRRLFCF